MNGRGRIQVLIRFGYDGSRFFGLQPLSDRPTAGGALQARVRDAAGGPEKALQFAARTDRGVHALKNLATCWFPSLPDVEAFRARVAAPRDDGLVDVDAAIVPTHVHARGSARGKRYRYVVEDGCGDEPAPSTHAWRIATRLDVERMRAAADALVGVHDFSSFRAPRCSSSTPVKELTSLRVAGPFDVGDGRRRVTVELAGTAFLRKMVRIVVGTLVETACGLRRPDDVPSILAARDRAAAGIVAPACGLVLVAVGCAWPDDGSALLPELVRRP